MVKVDLYSSEKLTVLRFPPSIDGKIINQLSITKINNLQSIEDSICGPLFEKLYDELHDEHNK